MSTRAILPVKISLTEGDFYTLWAPTWKEHGSEWQAFYGDTEKVLLFNSPEELLTHLEMTQSHELSSHPKWAEFTAIGDDRVVPDEKQEYDIIGAPKFLAGRPSHEHVSKIARIFQLTNSLAQVSGAEDAVIFFASHSVLGNVNRGSEHYTGEQGLGEWSAVGRVVLTNWEKVLASIDSQVRIVNTDELDAAAVSAAATRITEASSAREKAREEAKQQAEAERAATDPYDTSAWAAAGIDPVKITIQGKSVYTLRTYLDGAPVFLGKYAEMYTFPTNKQLLRWMLDNDDHDLARVSTWEDLVSSAHAGDLVLTVHKDNAYSFNGIAADILKGIDSVDTTQMGKAYEVMADAADWAGDDSLNSFLLANPRMQDYLAYMLGSTEAAGYVPSAPFNDKAENWTQLEDMLIKRFSKF
ncbi:hypothetical protein [Corynebacterium cystitidis]|uniref:Primosomal protein n=1 Tax=Corynebacterium cystitidis DSM 20524 TaxID=1121357 RepID=A0A1H9QTP4_9CORY|nr:hypothetical protein [Corynebacterium cystitidis]WJY81666.1 hypothetical protein CCYS_03505 [Corynebacterium cystitidis DSM 20524]SER63842.1 hypothetical protein SAMN05661109_00664 [Corynebacterium cystitidis DSM 20524]SNV85142.1 Uncharacterised protein [Corynebacterium cystitidis]